MSAILKRLPSTRQLPKITNPEPTTYQLLDLDQDNLTLAIKDKYKNADDLILEIEKLLSQGKLPDDYLVELIATFDSEKDVKRLKDKINHIYTKIINIYVDALIAINQDAINAVKIAELCSPKTSFTLNKRVNQLSDNLNTFITGKILGYSSLRKAEFRNKIISENERLKRRTIRLHMWIDIAKRSLEKHNDMGGLIIVVALDNQALRRLKKAKQGLNALAQSKLSELIDFKDKLFTSKGVTDYFTNIVHRVPVIPYPFGILKSIIQVAENEKEQTNNKSIWQKIEQLEYMDEVKALLLKEQHDIFALTLPIWEFITSKSENITHVFEIQGLIDRIYINPLDIEDTYAISHLIEPRESPDAVTTVKESSDKPDTKSLHKESVDKSDLKPLSSELMLYDPDNKELAPITPHEDYVVFRKWLKDNYLNKLKILQITLPELVSLNKSLKESSREYSLYELERHFNINEVLIVSIFQVLHSANVLRCLSLKFGADKLDIDSHLLEKTILDFTDSMPSIIKIREAYFEIHQRNMFGQEDNVEYASLKADITDFSYACEAIVNKIESYLKSGTFHELKQTKLLLKHLKEVHRKYAECVDKSNNTTNNFGNKILTAINSRYSDISSRLQRIEKLLADKEFSYLKNHLAEFINNWDSRYKQLSITFELSLKEENPKKVKSNLIDLMSKLEDLIIEFPLLLDIKFYKENTQLHKQISQLRNEIISLIERTEHSIKNIKQHTQKNKAPPSSDHSEIEKNISALRKRYPTGHTTLKTLPKSKLHNDLNQLICRRLNIPPQYMIGKFINNQGSLFYALAKSLNSLYGQKHFDEQTLRLMCFDFYLDNRDRVIKWQNEPKLSELDRDPYFKIRYTQHEMNKFFNKDALDGKYIQEGRALCLALKLSAICIIELHNKARNNALTARYITITEHQVTIVKSLNYLDCLAKKIPIIILNQEGCYIPLQQMMQIDKLKFENPEEPAKPDIDNSKRVRIKNEDGVKKIISTIVPKEFSLEAAFSEGDCFFDTAALSIKYLTQTAITVKSLRIMCADAAINKNDRYPWLQAALRKDEKDDASYQNYLARLPFTCDEMAELDQNKTLIGTATWGRPDIEGRIFAEEFNIELHIIEVLEEPVNGIQVIETIVNKNGTRQIEKMSPEDYLRPNMIHMLNHRLHFVPLLYKPPRQELAEETTTQSVEKLLPPRP